MIAETIETGMVHQDLVKVFTKVITKNSLDE